MKTVQINSLTCTTTTWTLSTWPIRWGLGTGSIIGSGIESGGGPSSCEQLLWLQQMHTSEEKQNIDVGLLGSHAILAGAHLWLCWVGIIWYRRWYYYCWGPCLRNNLSRFILFISTQHFFDLATEEGREDLLYLVKPDNAHCQYCKYKFNEMNEHDQANKMGMRQNRGVDIERYLTCNVNLCWRCRMTWHNVSLDTLSAKVSRKQGWIQRFCADNILKN